MNTLRGIYMMVYNSLDVKFIMFRSRGISLPVLIVTLLFTVQFVAINKIFRSCIRVGRPSTGWYLCYWWLVFSLYGRVWHDDVIKCKHFPRYWPFVSGIHRSPVDYPHKKPVTLSVDVFFYLRLNKRLSKQSRRRRRWFEMPLRSLWRQSNDLFQFDVNDTQYEWFILFPFFSVGGGGCCWWFVCLSLILNRSSCRGSRYRRLPLQWNLSVTTTSITKLSTCDLFSNVFQWRLKVPFYSC